MTTWRSKTWNGVNNLLCTQVTSHIVSIELSFWHCQLKRELFSDARKISFACAHIPNKIEWEENFLCKEIFFALTLAPIVSLFLVCEIEVKVDFDEEIENKRQSEFNKSKRNLKLWKMVLLTRSEMNFYFGRNLFFLFLSLLSSLRLFLSRFSSFFDFDVNLVAYETTEDTKTEWKKKMEEK